MSIVVVIHHCKSSDVPEKYNIDFKFIFVKLISFKFISSRHQTLVQYVNKYTNEFTFFFNKKYWSTVISNLSV